jgi:uncharacterized membrane protein YvlD (DUF360 family)
MNMPVAAAVGALSERLRRLVGFYALQIEMVRTWRSGPAGLIRRAVISFFVAFLALGTAVWAVPGISVTGWLPVALAVIVLAALNALIRPVVLALVAPISLVLVGVVMVAFEVGAILLLGPVVPGLEVRDVWSALAGALIFAVAHTLLGFVLALDQDESYYATLMRQLTARRKDVTRTDRPGVVIVQIDGLSHPVLSHQLRAGRVPNMARWIRSGRMRLSRWHALLPSQTSASQAGILHGSNERIPAFRWWDKPSQRLLVSNRPPDALEILQRVSNGRGLLSVDGVSIGNLLTGDAPRSYLTMAALADPEQGLGRSEGFFAFFLSPHTYVGSIILAIAETFKELVQAYRQRQRAIEPRLGRAFPYPLMRAATNVVLRSLNTALVIEEMCRGTSVIYVDYTDYDEIAHHTGPERSESLDALDGVDQVLGLMERAARDAPRPYRFIVLSDHGQTLGATFRQRTGQTLEEVIRDAMGGSRAVLAATGPSAPAQLNALLTETSGMRGPAGAVTRAAVRRRRSEGYVELGEQPAAGASLLRARDEGGAAAEGEGGAAEGEAGPPELVVCASGNLALVSFPLLPGRASRERIEERYPGLVDKLVNEPDIGLVMVRGEREGAVVLGSRGTHHLHPERVKGSDPLEVYGPHALEGLRRLDAMPECGDLVIVSAYYQETGEVAAFEELIGSHGGLGGDQTRPFILHPADWAVEEELVGAPAVFQQISGWLAGIGLGPGAVA